MLELHPKLHSGLLLADKYILLRGERLGFFPKYWHHKFTPLSIPKGTFFCTEFYCEIKFMLAYSEPRFTALIWYKSHK